MSRARGVGILKIHKSRCFVLPCIHLGVSDKWVLIAMESSIELCINRLITSQGRKLVLNDAKEEEEETFRELIRWLVVSGGDLCPKGCPQKKERKPRKRLGERGKKSSSIPAFKRLPFQFFWPGIFLSPASTMTGDSICPPFPSLPPPKNSSPYRRDHQKRLHAETMPFPTFLPSFLLTQQKVKSQTNTPRLLACLAYLAGLMSERGGKEISPSSPFP